MRNRLRTTYYTRKVALVEPVCTTIPGTDNLQEYNIVSYAMLGNKRYIRYNDSPWFLDKVMNDEGYTRFELGDEDYPFYYIKDHLGNIRETYVRTSGNKFCAQRMQYYPSGLPWDESQGASEQPFKYGSKEFIEMHGLDEYDSEARWYYPAIMRTTSMDPMCEKYYSTSPYAWCHNNPENYVDPDGRDDYEVYRNQKEKEVIIKQIENKNYDQFHIVDADGNRVASSNKYDYQTITKLRRGHWGESNLSLFDVKGDGNAEDLFKFLGSNFTEENGSPLEWSRVIVGTSNSGRNVIGTNMKEDATGVGHYIMSHGYTIRGVDHNHPGGTGPSNIDIDNARLYHLKFPSANLRVFSNGKYISYDENTPKRPIVSVELKAIEVIGRKK